MTQEYVRICPVCEASNPADQPLCSCGASLAGVDFSLKTEPSVVPGDFPHVDVAVVNAPPAGMMTCPHADCAQPNPVGRERCLYCNRPLSAAPAPPVETTGESRYTLPSVLRENYRLIEDFPATGSEADLMLVESLQSGERLVAKLYRKGIRPDSELLARLSQGAASHVVRLVEHGLSDGYAYELMEYCAHGTLRQLLDSGPLPREGVRRMVAELAAAIGEIHAQRILHRDLKPENILLRSMDPLQLALTDFGISSLQQATQHFTTLARTVKYAAPEALTGVLDEKADWWSLGMIVLEAASGRHPFEDLSEQVINHHLATRAIDVRQVFDDDLRKLCRGLLLRDPKRRWGAREVARWLAGDESLEAPEDSAGALLSIRPYRIGEAECTTTTELALALAKNWEDAGKDLKRGAIGAWLEQQLNDQNLARKLQDILDQRGVSDDYRLLRFLLVAAPDMPGVWRGKAITREDILTAANQALTDDKAAQAWLESIGNEQVLEAFSDAGASGYGELARLWREGWERFCILWETAHQAQEAWLATPKSMDGESSSAYVDIDEVMYSRPLRLAQPSRRSLNARLLLALNDPSLVDRMRVEVLAALGEISEYCPWFASVGDVSQLDPVSVLAARQLLPFARRDAADEKKRLGGYHDNREQNIASLRGRIETDLRLVIDAGKLSVTDQTARIELTTALARFHETAQKVMSLAYSEESFRKLQAFIESQTERAFALGEAFNQLDSVEEMNAIYIQPNRLALALGALAFIYVLAAPWAALVLATALASFGALRFSAWKAACKRVEEAFRAFVRQSRLLLRDSPTPDR